MKKKSFTINVNKVLNTTNNDYSYIYYMLFRGLLRNSNGLYSDKLTFPNSEFYQLITVYYDFNLHHVEGEQL